jgi:hypothetical protein
MSRTRVTPGGVPSDSTKVDKATLTAESVLAAITSGVPTPITMAASTVLARLASGDIVAATTAQIRTLLATPDPPIFTQLAANVDGLSFNSTALADITGLLVAVAVSSTYIVRGQILYEATTAADYGIGCTVPTGATFALHVVGVQTNVSAPNNLRGGKPIQATGGSQGVGGNGAAVVNVADVFGWIKTDSSHAGNLQMKHSQFTAAEATDIKAYAGSWLMAQKVA